MELYQTIFDKAAYLWYALSNYHCFYNGNKRTALVTTYVYLRMNGYCLKIDRSFYDISLSIAESDMEKEKIEEIIRENTVESHKISSENILKQLEMEIRKNCSFQDVIVKLSQT